MIKNYILYDANNNNIIQFVKCHENEIEDYQHNYIETEIENFIWENGFIYKIINNQIVKEERTDSLYLLNKINNEYSTNAKLVISGIPDDEALTFPIQKEEAKAWFKDNDEPTPFIDGILTKRTDVTKAQLVDKILEKANNYAYFAGTLTGERQAKEKQILGE